MTLSGGELSYLRDSHPHKTRMFLSVLKPRVIYVGQVTGSPARGARVITLVDVSGVRWETIAGMTVLVGTASGYDDIHDGRRRFRSRSGQDFTLDENNIEWANGQYLTFIENWELWPVFPFIALEKPHTFYKDYDIPYNPSSGQNDEIDPVAQIAGNHMVGFLDGPTITFTLDASGSYTMAQGATISSYAWSTVTGGGVIADSTAVTTTITFDTPNKNGIWITLIVTDSNQKTHKTKRVIFIHTRTGEHAPHYDLLVVDPPTGDWGEGGWKTKIEVRDDADITNYPDKSLCILWSKDYYDGTEVEIGDDANIKMVGYIRGDTIRTTTGADDSVRFVVTTIEDLMKRHRMFSVSLEYKENDQKWYHFNANGKGLTVAGAVHHLWHWHSTLLDITNVSLPTGNTVQLAAVDDFINGTLYSLAEGFAMQHGIFAHVCCNKLGEVHLEIDINILSDSQRAAKEIMMNVTKEDRRGDPLLDIVRETERTTAYGTVSGTSFDGTDSSPVISIGPGDVPYVDGAGELSLERQALSSQADGNEKIGRALAIVNNPFKLFPIMFAGNYGFVDIVPQKWYTISIAAEDTKRGIVLTDYKLVPRTVVNKFDPSTGTIMTDVVFDTNADGQDGIPGNYPTDLAEIPLPIIVTPTGGGIVSFDRVNGVHHRGSWTERNGDLSGGDIQDNWGDKDPWWFTGDKQASLDPAKVIMWKCDTGKIFRTTDQGVTWTDMTPSTGPDGHSPGSFDYIQYEGNNFWNYEHVFLTRKQAGGQWITYILHTDDDGVTWSWHLVGSEGGGTITLNSPGAESDYIVSEDTLTSASIAYLSYTKFVCVYTTSVYAGTDYPTNVVAAVVGTIDLDDNSISWGTEAIVYDSEQSSESVFARIVACDSSTVLVTYTRAAANQWIKGRTVYLTTPTTLGIGVETDIETATGQASTPYRTAKLAENKVIIWYQVLNGSDYEMYARYLQIFPSSTFTVNTRYINSAITSTTQQSNMALACLTDTLVGFHYREGAAHYHFVGERFGVAWSYGTEVQDAFGVAVDHYTLARQSDTRYVFAFSDEDFPNGEKVTLVSILVTGLSVSIGPTQVLSSVDVNSAGVEALGGDDEHVVVHNLWPSGGLKVIPVTWVGETATFGTSISARGSNYLGGKTLVAVWRTTDFGASPRTFTLTGQAMTYTGGYGGIKTKGIGISIDKANGNYLHFTGVSDDTNLVYKVFALPTFVEYNAVDIGACTVAQLDARTWFAFPEADAFGSLSCVVYGRMDDPLGGGTVHVMSTGSAGAAWTVQENGWGVHYCSALHVDRQGYLNAIRRKGTGSEYHRGISTLSYLLDTVLHVNPGSLKMTLDRYIILGGEAVVGGQMLLWSPYPFTAWNDFTEDHPTDGEITSLILI